MAGEDVRELKLSAVRGVVGYVPQDPVLFAGTLRDNLVYACPEADDAAIQAALTMAYAADFVGVLPEGLETRVGEGGVGLSGGQRQRLAIARALISEPQILLLDEATSALDAESENHIRLSIDGLKGRMTILVIAHRLSTVRQADHILVLEDGQVMNQGTHDQLLEASDLYGRFAQMQFAS